ncbi:MAG: hypothetical protein ACYC6R_02450 [Anaerolineales bacterium]
MQQETVQTHPLWKNRARAGKNHGSYMQEITDYLPGNALEFRQITDELCDHAQRAATDRLHPLLQRVDLEKLSQRHGFLHTFQQSLEREIAQKIVLWLPCVKVVYRFDASRRNNTEDWDNTIHLLVLVPQLIPMINELGTMLDGELLKSLNRLSWSRFQDSKSIIEIQQVTPEEMRHGICYGAMFFSYYAAPSQVWPSD